LTIPKPANAPPNQAPPKKDQRPSFSLFQKSESKKSPQVPKQLTNAKPGATIELTRQAKEREAKKAIEAVEKAKPGMTISLSSLFRFGDENSSSRQEVSPKTALSPPAKKTTETTKKVAPKGVPTIESWKVEKDKSITGFIRGSNLFRDGEKVTTSSISRGKIARGEVVVTSSGTRYFLM
jgi:hypothetical protein